MIALKVIIYIYSLFCSLKLAIFTLSALILLFAVGTVYESFQGRLAAQEVIYRSVLMNIFLSLLVLNIVAVMIDRWPWKKRHIAFLLAHFGIIFLITGALITRFYGVDGNMRLALGDKGRQITTSSTLLLVYSSFSGKDLTELYREKVHFFRSPPQPEKPHLVRLGSETLKVNDFYPSALAREKYEEAQKGGPALRFQIEGRQAQMVRWLYKAPWMDKMVFPLGPAEIILLKSVSSFKDIKLKKPSLLLVPFDKGLHYQLRKPKSQKIMKGSLKVGSVLKTGWMDFQFRLIDYLPVALPDTVFIPQKRAGDKTNSAIQVEFKGEKRWMGLNSHLFFFDDDKVYIVAYVNEKKDLGFQLRLKDFKVIRYPSSFKASSYESEVQVNASEDVKLISMNHPLKFSGYTIYQSGFEEDKEGVPVASVFAINKDPGRFIKYFGSLLIVIGSFVLFLRRNLRSRKKRL